jgi:L,D-peptidoglycan transpeptidase YkuD (ErfK/YbiS/YcfS/YnhG family)
VRSVWVGHVSCDVDTTGRCHAAGDFGCGACWDRHCATAGDSPPNRGRGPHIALPAVPGGGLRHRPEPGSRHRRRCATGHRRRSLDGELAATFTAWAKGTNGCWSPVSFAGQPAQPFRAQTGHGGLLPIAQRVPGDWATPTGLFPFGTTVYGNSAVSPTTRYPYHHLVCGDWWDEQPGSPAYDTFQHVPCGTTPPYGEDSEALWTEIQPYQHLIDIKMPHPPDNGAGIFLHDDMAVGYTEGCVALPNAELDAVLGWLNPADSPHILIAIS